MPASAVAPLHQLLLLLLSAASSLVPVAAAGARRGLAKSGRELSDPFERVTTMCLSSGNGGEARYLRSSVGRLLGDYVARVGCSGDNADDCRNDNSKWQQCLNASMSALDDDGTGWASRNETLDAAARLLYASLNRTSWCSGRGSTKTNSSDCRPPVDEFASFYAALGNNTLSRTERLLQLLEPLYRSRNVSRNPLKCFSSRTLLLTTGFDHSTDVDCSQLTIVASYVVAFVAQGYSINSSCPAQPSDWTLKADLVQQLNASVAGDLSLQVLLTRLGIGQASTTGGGDHRGHDDHDHIHGSHAHDLRRKRADYSTAQSATERRLWPAAFASDDHQNHDDRNDHEDHDHDAEHEQASPRQCLSSNQLISIYSASEHDDSSISMDDLHRMCPALLQQVLGQYCTSTSTPSTTAAPRTPSAAETYGYGTLAVLTVGAMPLLGVFVIPCLNTKASEMILTFFVALGAGAMLGDALLHLVPSILGEHNHRHEDEPQITEAGLNIPDSTWKMLVMCLVIYAFFVLEMVVTITKRSLHPSEENSGYHGHGHSHVTVPSIKAKPGIEPAIARKDHSSQDHDVEKEDITTENDVHMTSVASSDCIVGEKQHKRSKGIRGRISSVSPVVLILMLGDALHNFADGLTIGASFATRLTLGLTSTIAIVSHEVPHKLANIAVLLGAGYSQCSVLCFSLMSTCAAVASFYVGAVVGTNETVASYIFAATAASFFYVCLLDLLPEIMHRKTNSPWKHFLVMNTGILTGFAFMLLFSIFEDQIDLD